MSKTCVEENPSAQSAAQRTIVEIQLDIWLFGCDGGRAVYLVTCRCLQHVSDGLARRTCLGLCI